jgi:phospholipase C
MEKKVSHSPPNAKIRMRLTCILFLSLLLSSTTRATGPIKTVVVVVMENRSFDHMLGWMKRLNPEINGVTGSEWNPVSTTDPNSAKVFFSDGAHFVDPDPGHSFQAIREQIFGSNDTSASVAPMNGFVQQARSMSDNMTDAVMNGFAPDKVAVYQELVQEFAVFDRWFASVPTSTQPNRMFVHSATSGGATSNDAAYVPCFSSCYFFYFLRFNKSFQSIFFLLNFRMHVILLLMCNACIKE